MEINEDDFLAYEMVRQSGVTNMMNVEFVCELTGLEKEQVFDIMKNYSEYKGIYG